MKQVAAFAVTLGAPRPRDAARARSTAWFILVLLLRAGVVFVFALWLLSGAPGWSDIFRAGAYYALIDGGLGLCMATLLMRHRPTSAPPLLVALTLVDACLRSGAGFAVLLFPGIPHFPITVVLLYGALGVWAAMAGLTAMIAWGAAHVRQRFASGPEPSRVHEIFDPLSVAGVVALISVVSALIAGPPARAASLRFVAGITSAALGLAFLGAGVRLARHREPPDSPGG